MKSVNVGVFWYLRYIFRFFQNIFRKKPILWDVQIRLVNIYCSYNFWGIFGSRTVFIFLVALTKKKYAPSEVFSHKISPNWPMRQFETTVDSSDVLREPLQMGRTSMGRDLGTWSVDDDMHKYGS